MGAPFCLEAWGSGTPAQSSDLGITLDVIALTYALNHGFSVFPRILAGFMGSL